MSEPSQLAAAICAAILDKEGAIAGGRNAKYASSEAILGEVRGALARNGIAVICHHTVQQLPELVQEKSGRDGKYTVTTYRWLVTPSLELIHVSGERLTTTHGPVETSDQGDKALLKGYTVALRYALQELLLIPRGDDPEADDPADKVPATETETRARNPEPETERPRKLTGQEIRDEGRARIEGLGADTVALFNEWARKAKGQPDPMDVLSEILLPRMAEAVFAGVVPSQLAAWAESAVGRAIARLAELDGVVRDLCGEPPAEWSPQAVVDRWAECDRRELEERVQ
jgi:hypothetical protein